jgi:hypothetical protein
MLGATPPNMAVHFDRPLHPKGGRAAVQLDRTAQGRPAATDQSPEGTAEGIGSSSRMGSHWDCINRIPLKTDGRPMGTHAMASKVRTVGRDRKSPK